MSRLASRYALGLALLMSAWFAGSASGGEPTQTTAQVSAETIPLGNTFELRVNLTVPSGSTVSFPGELPSSEAVESHGPVRWTAEALDRRCDAESDLSTHRLWHW